MNKRGVVLTTMAMVMAAFVQSARAEYRLTVLHINDLHSRLEPVSRFNSTCSSEDRSAGECFGGIARVKTKIDERRNRILAGGGNVLVLDAGDQFQGSLFYTNYKGKVAALSMNAIGFDAMAVGNHEFDDGPSVLARFIDQVETTVISTNIDVSGDPELAGKVLPSKVIELGGRKIGIVSALAEDTPETSSPGETIIFNPAQAALSAEIKRLEEEGVNIILALNHAGLSRDIELAKSVNGIDAVIGGHSHSLLSNVVEDADGPYPVWVETGSGKSVPVVQAYAYSKFVGEVEFVFDDEGNLTEAFGEPHLLDGTVTPDLDLEGRIAEFAEPLDQLRQQEIGVVKGNIDGSREVCRVAECEMGNLVADAMLERVASQGVSIALQNGGGLRASIDEGRVTMGDVLSVLPFQNTLSTFEIEGRHILSALENGVSGVEEGAGRFLQVSGLHYTWDPSKAPLDGRILSVEVATEEGFEPLDPDKVYGVVSNNFLRNGGDGYSMFAEHALKAYDFGPGLEEVLADYIALHPDYDPFVEGRIKENR